MTSKEVFHEDHTKEVRSGERFEFGANWQRFLAVLDESRIVAAENSMLQMLGKVALNGRRFLDAGSGSGLSSLIARRKGAIVHSFDFDPQSVACTNELRQRYFPDDPNWQVERGSVLDQSYLQNLGTFDIVYSWGVLHHTGHMWDALGNVAPLVAEGGHLYIAIYNDQGKMSRRWKWVKKTYNSLPAKLRFLVLWPSFVALWGRPIIKDILTGHPFRQWREYGSGRGMSPWPDVVDWVGGYPFEVAKPEEIFNFYRDRGFTLIEMKTEAGELGCNEFVFRKIPTPVAT